MDELEHIPVSRHAKKRIKNRVHKNWQKAADEAWAYGLTQDELSGRLKKQVEYIVFQDYKHGGMVSSYKLYNDNIYLFGYGHRLVTVLHVRQKHAKLAVRLTQEKLDRLNRERTDHEESD